jgi:hypothetical protein
VGQSSFSSIKETEQTEENAVAAPDLGAAL